MAGAAVKRSVIAVEGLSHRGQPIPLAVRRGPLLVSGSISGRGRATGERPDSLRTEIRNAFDNLQAVLCAGGMSLDCVVRIEVALSDLALRAEVNEVWEELFPAADDRPVRHTTRGQLPGDLRVQLSVTAIDE
jgi:enamine deaminase RidA (YjgF/YER057c/UK114 family)